LDAFFFYKKVLYGNIWKRIVEDVEMNGDFLWIFSILIIQKWLQLTIFCDKLSMKLYRRSITMPFFRCSYASGHSYACNPVGAERSAATSEKMRAKARRKMEEN